jgi:trimeric autotransporter adhesin
MTFTTETNVALTIAGEGDIIIANTGGTLQTATAGTSNFRAGVNAGNSIESGGNYNTVVGDEAGTAITTGDYNTALGYQAGAAITTGIQNTFVGGLCGDGTDDGNYNTAVGLQALSANCGDSNTAIGESALSVNTASNNTAVGKAALYANTTGADNTALGIRCFSRKHHRC